MKNLLFIPLLSVFALTSPVMAVAPDQPTLVEKIAIAPRVFLIEYVIDAVRYNHH